MAKNIFDQFDEAPAKISREDRFPKIDRQGQIDILTQEYQATLARKPDPRRDEDLAALRRELKSLGVNIPAPAADTLPTPAPVVTEPQPMQAETPQPQAQGLDASGRRTAATDPRLITPAAGPRRGSLRALAQGVPGVQVSESPTAAGFESGVVKGATAGLDIYARAAARKLQRGGSFEDNLRAVRAEQAAIREASPVAAGIGELGGTIGTALATGGTSLLRQIGTSAAQSGAQKFSESSETGVRDVAQAAALGGGLTGAIGGVGRVVSNTATRLSNNQIAKELERISQIKSPAKAEQELARAGFIRPGAYSENSRYFGDLSGMKPQQFAQDLAEDFRSAARGKFADPVNPRSLQEDAQALKKANRALETAKLSGNEQQIKTAQLAKERAKKAFDEGREFAQLRKDLVDRVTEKEFINIYTRNRTGIGTGLGALGGGGLAGYDMYTSEEGKFDPTAVLAGAALGGGLVPLKVMGARWAAGQTSARPAVRAGLSVGEKAARGSVPALSNAVVSTGQPMPAEFTEVNVFDQFD